MALERPPVEPDLRRLAIIELGFLILAVGMVLVLRAQFFEVRIQGSFGRPDSALQSGWVVLAGVLALSLGAMVMAGALMPKRPSRPTTFVAFLGLALSIVVFVVLVMPFPSFSLGTTNAVDQSYKFNNEPNWFKQEQWYNVLSAIGMTFSLLNLFFLSLHEILAPEGSLLLPREEKRPPEKFVVRRRDTGNGSLPLVKCPHCTRRFVATAGSKRCPNCDKPFELAR